METTDRPLHGAPFPRTRLHPRLYLAELLGTALLVSIGLSIVIVFFSTNATDGQWNMSAAVRRAITGALFGTTGTLIALSPLGRISGAHINPAVSLAFWISGKLRWRDMVGYGSAQFAGALLGACTLLARGSARCKRALWRDNGWDECQYRPGAGWGNCRHSRADPGHFCDLCPSEHAAAHALDYAAVICMAGVVGSPALGRERQPGAQLRPRSDFR